MTTKIDDEVGPVLAKLMATYEQEFRDDGDAGSFLHPPEVRARLVVEDKRNRMIERGWPLRALEIAQVATTDSPAIEQIASWNHVERNVVVLAGQAGCGKTVAAAFWALGRRERIEFVRASTFAASSRYDEEKRSKWYDAQGLCLDDLGAEYLDAKGSFLVDLDELIDTYYAAKRPLLITTNCNKQSFKQRYGERVTDRLRECAAWLTVTGGSQRKGGA